MTLGTDQVAQALTAVGNANVVQGTAVCNGDTGYVSSGGAAYVLQAGELSGQPEVSSGVGTTNGVLVNSGVETSQVGMVQVAAVRKGTLPGRVMPTVNSSGQVTAGVTVAHTYVGSGVDGAPAVVSGDEVASTLQKAGLPRNRKKDRHSSRGLKANPDGQSLEFGKVSILKRQDSLGDIEDVPESSLEGCVKQSNTFNMDEDAKEGTECELVKMYEDRAKPRRVARERAPKGKSSDKAETCLFEGLRGPRRVADIFGLNRNVVAFSVEEVPGLLLEGIASSDFSDPAKELSVSIVTGEPVPPMEGAYRKEDLKKTAGGGASKPQEGSNGKAKSVSPVVQRIVKKLRSFSDLVMWLTAGEMCHKSLAGAIFKGLSAKLGVGEDLDYLLAKLLVAGQEDAILLKAASRFSSELASVMSHTVYGVWEKSRLTGRAARVSLDTPSTPSTPHQSDDETSLHSDEDRTPQPFVAGLRNVEIRCGDLRGSIDLDLGMSVSMIKATLDASMAELVPASVGTVVDWKYRVGHKRLELDSMASDYDWYRITVIQNGRGGSKTGAGYVNLPDEFVDVESGTGTVDGLMHIVPSVGRYIDVTGELTARCGLTNSGGISNNTGDQLICRGTSVRDTGTSSSAALPNPVSLLKPFNLIRANVIGFGLEDAQHGVDGYVVATKMCRAHGTTAPTELAENFTALTARGGSVKPDTLTSTMFYASDTLRYLSASYANQGDAMTSWYLKLQLYEYILAWRGASNVLPLASELGQWDSFATVTVPTPQPNLTYNDNANHGGYFTSCINAGVLWFPFSGARQYTVTFHNSLTTVPLGRPCFFVPSTLMATSDNDFPSLAYALMCMCIAPYPCGIWSFNAVSLVQGETVDLVKNSMPWANAVSISGSFDFHLVIPQMAGSNRINTQAAANSACCWPPVCGPTASSDGVYAPGQALDVAYRDANGVLVATAYRLSSYLFTWLKNPNSPVDITTLSRFRSQLAMITGRYTDLRFAQEFGALLACRFPVCTVSARTYDLNAPQRNFYVNNSRSQWGSQNFFAVKPHMFGDGETFGTLQAAVPANVVDFFIPDMSLIWWNKIALGLIVPNVDDGNFRGLETDGNQLQLSLMSTIATQYALVSQVIFAYYPYSCATWNLAFQSLNLSGIAAELRRFFAQGHMLHGDSSICSDLGELCDSIHRQVNGCDPAPSSSGLSVWSIMNTPKDGFASAVSGDEEFEALCPVILCDYYIQMLSKVKLLEFMGFVTVNKGQYGLLSEGAHVLPLNGIEYSTPVKPFELGLSIDNTSVVTRDAKTTYNMRLTAIMFDTHFTDMRGLVQGGFAAPGTIVIRKKNPRDGYIAPGTLYNVSLIGVCSTVYPFISSTGVRLYMTVPDAAGSSQMTRIMAGVEPARVSAWVRPSAVLRPLTVVASNSSQKSRLVGRKLGNGSGLSGSGSESLTGQEDRA